MFWKKKPKYQTTQITKNNFEELEEEKQMPDGSEMQLFAQIDQTRSFGKIFGNFFEQISGLIAMILGKK